MPKHFRIATWNLDRSGVRRTSRMPLQLEKIRQLNADLWILMETHSAIALEGYESLASQHDPDYRKQGESYVTIWSRSSLRRIETQDPLFTVCAELTLPSNSAKVLLYGTIITYGTDGVSEGLAQPWQRHRAAVRMQTKEWLKLRAEYPDHVLCVAGDFNANLDGTRWYGVPDTKKGIELALVAGGMHCATGANLRVPPYNSSAQPSITSVCRTTCARRSSWKRGRAPSINAS
jgi:hypothetical protein